MEKRIKQIMEEVLKEQITDDFSKESTDNWDSFTHLDLIVNLENEFNISFTPEEMVKMNSYQDIISIIKEKID